MGPHLVDCLEKQMGPQLGPCLEHLWDERTAQKSESQMGCHWDSRLGSSTALHLEMQMEQWTELQKVRKSCWSRLETCKKARYR